MIPNSSYSRREHFMIEIPESVMLASQISTSFIGKTVSAVQAGQTRHGFAWYEPDPEEYPLLLRNKKLTQVNSNGGQVELIFEDMHLVLNDGTTPHFLAPSELPPKKHQLLIRFEDGSGFYCTIRMYGGMMIYPNGETTNEYYLVSLNKPSPLTREFDRAYFQDLFDATDSKLSAKALLATEQRIPGLGNGVLHDILFNAGIHPQRKIKDLDAAEVDTLYNSVKGTLEKMTELGGRDTEKDLFGEPGGYLTVLSSKTKEEPCPECGSKIIKKAYLGGSIYFCPHCQPL